MGHKNTDILKKLQQILCDYQEDYESNNDNMWKKEFFRNGKCIDETANAGTYLNSLNKISTWRGSGFVFPLKCPEITETAPNSPIALAAHSTTP